MRPPGAPSPSRHGTSAWPWPRLGGVSHNNWDGTPCLHHLVRTPAICVASVPRVAISPSMSSVPVVTASSSACPPTVRHPLTAAFSRRSPDFLHSRCSALALRRTAALQPDRMPARAVHRQRSLSRGVLRSLRTAGGAVPRCGVRAARLSSCAWSRGNAWGVRPGRVARSRGRCRTIRPFSVSNPLYQGAGHR